MWFKLAWLLAFFFLAAPVSAEYPRRHVVSLWSSDDGLPGNIIQCLAQTPDGYLWIGTRTGLARFDGVSFRSYTRANTPELLHDNCISMTVDKAGALWIGTRDGLMRYSQGRFRGFGLEHGLRHTFINTLEAGSDGLWIGTAGGITLLKDGEFQHFSPPGTRNLSSEIYEALDGSVFAANRHGLFKFDREERTFAPVIPASEFREAFHRAGTWMPRFTSDAQSNLWLGCNTGLLKLSNRARELYDETRGVPRRIEGLICDRRGRVWAATQQGIYHLADNRFEPVILNTFPAINYVRCLLEDSEGNIWAGSHGQGLIKLTLPPIVTLTEQSGLLAKRVQGISAGPDGTVWAATREGATQFRGGKAVRQMTAETLRETLVRSGLPHVPKPVRIESILADSRSNLWISLYFPVLIRINTHRTNLYVSELLVRGFLPPYMLAEGPSGSIWSTSERTILRLTESKRELFITPENWSFAEKTDRRFRAPHGLSFIDTNGMHQKSFHSVLEERSGAFWFGSKDAGVMRRSDAGILTLNTNNGLLSNYAVPLKEDTDGNIWIGSNKGLHRWRDGTLRTITTAHGLPTDALFTLQDDSRGNFWFGWNGGIFRVKRAELNTVADGLAPRLEMVTYGSAEGMLNNEISGVHFPNSCRAADGKLWFATLEGIAIVDPKECLEAERPPTVHVEAIRLDEKTFWEPGSNMNASHEIKLPSAHRKILHIAYTAPSFTSPRRLRFRYRLFGHDKDWIEAGDRRFAQYTSLRPGKYRFEVIARSGEGTWTPAPAAAAFSIAPKVHETWLFYGSCTAALLFLTLGIQRYRLRVQYRILQLEQENAIARERTRIAQDMHDDLGSSLTRIKMLSEVARFGGDGSTEMRRQLDQISVAAVEITRDMDEIVWAINPKYDLLDDLATYFARHAEEFLRASSIRCHLLIPAELPRIPISADKRHKVFLAFKEALNNIVKHAQATEVWIALQLEGGKLRLEIRDNGTGFVPNGRNRGNGLGNVRQRLEQVGGRASISSNCHGTVIECEVPLETGAEESS